MKMNIKKYLKPIVFIIIGLLLGWIIFSSSSNRNSSGNKISEGHNEEVHKTEKETIWTCSMHPQIRRKKPGKCPICGMTLIPLDNNSSDDNKAVLKMTKSAVELANIQTEVVKLTNPIKELYLNGKVEIDERRVYSQIAHISGRIEKLYVNFEGQKVTKGQKIATIYSPELFTAQKELLEAVKLKSTLPKLYQSAVEKLKLWKITDKQIEEIVKSNKVKSQLDILADVSGFVIKQNIFLGSQVKLGDVLFKIADLSKVWIDFDVYETDLNWVKKGDVVTYEVSSYPGRKFKTRISYIDPTVNAKDRTIKAWAEVRNSNNILKPEMFIKALLIAKLPFRQKKIIVPKSAVMWTGKRSVVYVKIKDSKTPAFGLREVTLGSNLGNSYIIENGLNVGEEVVVYGTFKIDAAAQLAGKYSSMNREPEKEEVKQTEDKNFSSDTPKKFKNQMKSLVLAYLDLTDALINSDGNKAKSKSQNMIDKLSDVDMTLLSNQGHIYWLQQKNIIKKNIELISQTTDIEEQRKAYINLSDAMIKSVKAFGANLKLFVDFCPMANSKEGARWISLKKKIFNPYFGDKMLDCGSVKETIGR